MRKFRKIAYAILGLTIGFVTFHLDGVVDDLSEELEQKEQKIEELQEENALLHDDIWNLNQALMKGESK